MSTSPDLASPDIVATPHWRLRIKPTRADPRIFVALAIAVALHIALGFVLARIDSLRDETPTAAQEIPVEIVEEPPPPDVKSEQRPQSPVPPSREQTEAQAQQEAADAAPQHAEKSPEPLQSPPQSPQEMSQTRSLVPAPQQAQAAAAPTADPTNPQSGAREPPPPPLGEATNKPATRKGDKPSAATAEFFLVPETFQTAALPAADKETNDDYKGIVFDRLERAKIEPAAARARGARGVAVLSILLDQAGNVVTASLVRSTGDRELDSEVMAMARRAAPFPKPPSGATLTFTPQVRFGMD